MKSFPSVTATAVCPSWCALPADHPYFEDEKVKHRWHSTDPNHDELDVRIEQEEKRGPRGKVTLLVAEIVHDRHDEQHWTTTDEARSLAADLLKAAFLLDQITAPQS